MLFVKTTETSILNENNTSFTGPLIIEKRAHGPYRMQSSLDFFRGNFDYQPAMKIYSTTLQYIECRSLSKVNLGHVVDTPGALLGPYGVKM